MVPGHPDLSHSRKCLKNPDSQHQGRHPLHFHFPLLSLHFCLLPEEGGERGLAQTCYPRSHLICCYVPAMGDTVFYRCVLVQQGKSVHSCESQEQADVS